MKKILYSIVIIIGFLICVESVKAAEANYVYDNNSLINATLILDAETGFWGNMEVVKCGNVDIPAPIPPITRIIVTFIKIAVPLVLIIMGMIDMMMAVVSSDENKMKESQSKFPKRLIPAALVFLVVAIIQFLVGFFAPEDSESLMKCVNCMINSESSCGIQNTDSDPTPTPPKPGIDNTEDLIN